MSKQPSVALDKDNEFDRYIYLYRKHAIALNKAKVLKTDLEDLGSQILDRIKKSGKAGVKRKGVTFSLIHDLSVKSCAEQADVVAALKASKRTDMLSANWAKLKGWVKGRCGSGDDYDAAKLPKPLRSVLSVEPFVKLSVTGIK